MSGSNSEDKPPPCTEPDPKGSHGRNLETGRSPGSTLPKHQFTQTLYEKDLRKESVRVTYNHNRFRDSYTCPSFGEKSRQIISKGLNYPVL